MIRIFEQGGGQWFNYKLKYPFDDIITQSASPAIDDPRMLLS